ncbi:MAG: CBS domain-containing protein [Myxococcales bacterium]|nr:CBS domain-containing protein [Myxococcales bacterium]
MADTTVPKVAADIMTRQVITLSPEDTLENIEEGMKRFRFRHLPVVDAEGALLGIVTHRDLLAASSSILSADMDKRNDVIRKRGRVEMIMHRDVATVDRNESLARVADTMMDNKIGSVVVVDDKKHVLGIITEADFVALCSQLLRELWSGSLPPQAP